MPALLALFGPKRGVHLDLAGALTVGRSSTTGLQLIDEKVSREHCRFVAEGEIVRVEDLGSQNGTYVNGERIEAPREITAGDEIAVGDSLFLLDGELDAAVARFGDATLVVSNSTRAAGRPDAREPMVSAKNGREERPDLAPVVALAAALARAPDTESTARAALMAMEAALKPDRAFVLLWDAARKRVTPLVGKSDGSAVSISQTVLETAAASGRALVVDDAVEDRDLKEARSVVRHGLHSVLVAPVVVDGVVTGFLHADRKAKGAYGLADAALIEAFAAVTAVRGLTNPFARSAADSRAPAAGPRPATASASASVRNARGREDDWPRPAGGSAALREALRIAEQAAPVSSTLLITGESGTGKEEVARFIHGAGPRVSRPFVAVNCGAIPEALAESELFGHEKGAFTGATGTREGKVEAADGGTLFLDEIGDLPPSIQVKLLRVLQERAFYRVGSTVPRRVDVRVLAATHRDLEAEVKAGRFREDLFYRLNVLRIHLSPLRERPEDLEPLAHALLEKISMGLGRRNPGLSDEAVARLSAARWPGNARELSNVLERMLVLRSPGVEGPLSSPEVAAAFGGSAPTTTDSAAAAGTLGEKIALLERTEIEAALRRARGVKTRAAESLGISRPTLDKKIADLGIDLWAEEQG